METNEVMRRLAYVTHLDVIKTDGRDRFRTLPRDKDQSLLAVEIYVKFNSCSVC